MSFSAADFTGLAETVAALKLYEPHPDDEKRRNLLTALISASPMLASSAIVFWERLTATWHLRVPYMLFIRDTNGVPSRAAIVRF
jgi:hypothetical protein